MKYLALCGVILIVVLVGCSGTPPVATPFADNSTADEQTETPGANRFSLGRTVSQPTRPPTITPTQLPSATPTCGPRVDWESYTIQPGDTLVEIAQFYQTTVSSLATANCISNPNRIGRGQVIYVPPAGATLESSSADAVNVTIPTVNALQDLGLSIEPRLVADGAYQVVAVGQSLTLRLDEVPENTARVDFIFAPEGVATDSGAQLLGRDANLGDGASILWVAEADVTGNLVAYAFDAAGTEVGRSITVALYSTFVTEGNASPVPAALAAPAATPTAAGIAATLPAGGNFQNNAIAFTYTPGWSVESDQPGTVLLLNEGVRVTIRYFERTASIDSSPPVPNSIRITETSFPSLLGVTIRRDAVVVGSNTKALIYNVQGVDRIEAGNLVFAIRADGVGADFDTISISADIKQSLDGIVQTLAIVPQ